MSEDTKKPTYELLEDGKVMLNHKNGKATHIASYNPETAELEFETDMYEKLHRTKVVSAIGEDPETHLQNANKVKHFTIKGRPKDVIKPNEPKKPLGTKAMGDKTPAVVDWFFKWRPQAAYVRYGVSLDRSGNPIIVHGYREDQGFVTDPRTGLISLEKIVTEKVDGFLATRGTHLTFTKAEVVGHKELDTEEEAYADDAQDGEEGDE